MAATTLDDTVARLRTMTGAQVSEFSATELEAIVQRSVDGWDTDYTITDIDAHSLEEALVLTLAMIELCYARAANASLNYPMRGEYFESQKNKIVDNNLAIAAALRDQLSEIQDSLTTGDSEVLTSELLRVNRFGQRVPLTLSKTPSAVTLTATASGSDMLLSWTPAATEIDFESYRIYRRDTSSVLDSYQSTGVHENSTCVYVGTDRTFTYHKDQSLTAGAYYYSLGVYNRSGLKAFSAVASDTIS